MRFTKVLLAVATVALLTTGTGVALAAVGDSGGTSPSPGSRARAAAPVSSGIVALQRTRFIYEPTGSITVPAGFQPIHPPKTINCTGSGTCTVGFEQNVQIKGSTADNTWAICQQVDGAFLTEPSCPFQGAVPNGTFGSGSFAQQKTGLSLGTHTVQTFVYTDKGAEVGIFNIIVRLYKP